MNNHQNKPVESPSQVIISSGDSLNTPVMSVESMQNDQTIRQVKKFGYLIAGLTGISLILMLLPNVLTGDFSSISLSFFMVFALFKLFIGLGLMARSKIAFVLFQLMAFLYIFLLLFVVPLSVGTGGLTPPYTDPLLLTFAFVTLAVEVAECAVWVWGFFSMSPAKVHPVLRKI